MSSDFGRRFELTLLTADLELAAIADAAGVQRIGADLERLGKAERQGAAENRISHHTIQDLKKISTALQSAKLFARINPIHSGTADEIEAVLEVGASVIMLPFFRTTTEVERFVGLVAGRARVAILIETSSALLRIRQILAVEGVDEVTIGFNDLRHEFGVHSHFEVMGSPLMDAVAAEAVRRGVPLSMGGVARPDDTELPMPVDLVYAQYPRLSATGAWIARSFLRRGANEKQFADDVQRLRERLSWWAEQPPQALEAARTELLLRSQRM